jgi:radical SAM protein with 4Fe4S-binding SPASM domain
MGRARCDWPWRGAYVAYSGEAMPCCMVATPDRANLGSMTKEGVVKVWNGPAYRNFRDRLESTQPPDICKGCAVYQGRF